MCGSGQNRPIFAVHALENLAWFINIRFMVGRLINILLVAALLTCPLRSWSGYGCAECGPIQVSSKTKTCCCASRGKSGQDQLASPTKPSEPAKPSQPDGKKCNCNCLCSGAILPAVFEFELDSHWQFVFANPLIAKVTSDPTLAVGCRGPDPRSVSSPANLGRAMRQWHSSFTI